MSDSSNLESKNKENSLPKNEKDPSSSQADVPNYGATKSAKGSRHRSGHKTLAATTQKSSNPAIEVIETPADDSKKVKHGHRKSESRRQSVQETIGTFSVSP